VFVERQRLHVLAPARMQQLGWVDHPVLAGRVADVRADTATGRHPAPALGVVPEQLARVAADPLQNVDGLDVEDSAVAVVASDAVQRQAL
jgi:hypothetical protein